ncbi:MAG: ribbon-helix-helix domain-containing protein [bacterium]|nr:ribbon-helix-helix domain-containing protein [bacterium]
MRRIQIYVHADLDEALSAEATRLGTSRSALVRDAVRASLEAYFDNPADAFDELIGGVDVDPDDDLDSVIYAPRQSL